jgi:protein TonB
MFARAGLALAFLLSALGCASPGGLGAGAAGQVDPGGPVPRDLELAEPVEVTESDVLVAPVAIESPVPRYTDELRRAGVQGIVKLRCIIGRDGSVKIHKVLRSDHPALAQIAKNTTARYRFQPATLNGRPVTVYYDITHTFRVVGP